MTDELSIGLSDIVLSEAKNFEKQQELLQRVFKAFDYNPIKTSTIEYSESIEGALGPELKKSSIEFFGAAGERLMLRPDHTTPIARTVAARMRDEALPLKLSYIDSVFRRPAKSWEQTELFQAGCEYIGDASPQADAEIILCCIESLKALGFDDIGVDIGHVDFVKGLDDEKRKALLAGDYVAFGSIPERGSSLDNVPASLEETVQLIRDKGYQDCLHINKGLVHGIYYYTGLIFEVYVKGLPNVVASGGRYDNLFKEFDYDQPAVGFAINLNNLRV